MQAVALATGDEFLVPYNLTINANDVAEYMKNLTWVWYTSALIQFIGFDDQFGIRFAPIIGSSGICFNFNMDNPEDIFHLDMQVPQATLD
jgi:hypothetical protein